MHYVKAKTVIYEFTVLVDYLLAFAIPSNNLQRIDDYGENEPKSHRTPFLVRVFYQIYKHHFRSCLFDDPLMFL